MSKKILFMVVIMCIVGLVIFTSEKINYSNEISMGKKIDLTNFKDVDIVVKVGGNEVSKLDFEKIKLYYNLDNYQDTENIIINNLIIKELAKKEGINPTKEDIEEYIKETKVVIRYNSDIRNKFYDFLTKIGQSEEEYWNDQSVFKRYEIALIIGRYRQLISNNILKKNSELELNEVDKIVSKVFEKTLHNEKNKIAIEYYY